VNAEGRAPVGEPGTPKFIRDDEHRQGTDPTSPREPGVTGNPQSARSIVTGRTPDVPPVTPTWPLTASEPMFPSCDVCGRDIRWMRTDARTCSAACRQRAYRLRKSER